MEYGVNDVEENLDFIKEEFEILRTVLQQIQATDTSKSTDIIQNY